MKLEELIGEYDLRVKADEALAKVDWNYDVNGVEGRRFANGQKAMNEAQAVVKSLYAKFPEVAHELWKTHCPYYNGTMPTWVLS